jgi:enterochelin esterase-like enzyme/outer membrane protein assembly factor BamB
MRRRQALFVVLICVGMALPTAADTGWPGFRGPNRDGSAPDASLFEGGAAALSLGWKRALGSGYSAIAVGDGRLVTMFAEGDADLLAAFDVETGDEQWRYRIADTYPGHNGSEDGPISTPLLAGVRVYALGPRGDLVAVEAATGAKIWAKHLVEDFGAVEPFYGFTTSPLLADGVLVVEVGAEEEGKAIAGLDPDSGDPLWTTGHDTFEYHSPVAATIGGRPQVLAAGKSNIYGLEAKSGEVLWSYEHGGDERAMGGFTIVPLPAGEDRLFLMNKIDSSVMLQVGENDGRYEARELWSANGIKQSYVTPVYHDGYIYGMSNRILTCLDAATGEIQWRSRTPGDGFPTLVGDKLVIITKPGTLHVAEASSESYNELARLDLFEERSWSEVAYAGGHLFARSMAHLARIDPGAAAATPGAGAWISGTGFGRFLAEVDEAEDKNALLDAFLEEQSSFPIVEESGAVHFLYRGEAEDVGIVGDMIGYRREDPMTRLDGIDLYYWSTRLEPDAAVTYGFIVDYAEEAIADPMSSRPASGLFGEVSWFAMPGWRGPDPFGEADVSTQGRVETVEWESAAREGQQRTARVYLPTGYDDGERRYPVIYVHGGRAALAHGNLKDALDELIGASVEPLIAVFVLEDEEDPRGDLYHDAYAEMVVNELVPKIDAEYRTIDDPRARASVGAGRGAGEVAVTGAFGHPGLFGRTAGQSTTLSLRDLEGLERGAEELPMVIYLDWGSYHMRSPHEGWDYAVENRKVWEALQEAGYRPAGGQRNEGFGWPIWNAHTEEILTALFPLRD